VCGASIVLAVVVIVISVFMMHSALPAYYESLDINDIMTHLEAFQTIADQNGNSRGTLYGFNQSAAYVYSVLAATGLEIVVQEFSLNAYRTINKTVVAQVNSATGEFVAFADTEYRDVQYSGSANVVANVTSLSPTASGCLLT